MASTTPVIVNTRRNSLDHTGIRVGGWIPLSPHHSTDEVTLHQKLKIFLSSYFSILSLFSIFLLFHSFNQTDFKDIFRLALRVFVQCSNF